MRKLLWIALICVALMTLATSAFAYRLILIPVGEVLPESVYKLELSGPYSNTLQEWLPAWRFDGTVMKNLEIGFKSSGNPGSLHVTNTLGTITWQIMSEKPDSVGLGVGMMNVYDSKDRPSIDNSPFIGIWKSFKLPVNKYPIKVHVVQGWKNCNGLQGGVIVPLSKRFSFAAEYLPTNMFLPGQDSHFVWALGYNQTKNWRFKYACVGGEDSAIGVVYTSNWLSK